MVERPLNILMLSPGYPAEMVLFTRAIAQVGGRVFGVGDTPEGAIEPRARDVLSGYLQVKSLWDEAAVVDAVRRWPLARHLDRVESLWEPGMLLAARLREALDLPGMSISETVPFRDKEAMKSVLDKAGIRTPKHFRARSESEVRAAAEALGWPLVVKPIAGAGSADTHRVDGSEDLERVLQRTRHVPEVSVEEFIDGEEYTFDTICANGKILYHNISWYRPRPLVARTTEWISPQTIALRDVEAPHLAAGTRMGQEVMRALGFRNGFTHMEWFLTQKGEAVFGEIGARPAGARSTEIMNLSADIDVYTAWAEAVTRGTLSQSIQRRNNAAIICKRAQGQGRIRRIDGLERLKQAFGPHLVAVDLLPVGAFRRNWLQTLLSDGWLIVRHPDLATTCAMADRVGTDLQMFAA